MSARRCCSSTTARSSATTLPRCSTALRAAPSLLASAERTLWDRGTAHALGGLDPEAASSLLERELGRPIEAEERPAAEAVIKGLDGRPQSLVEVAALLADGRVSLSELAAEPTALAESRDLEALSDSQRRILELLATLAGAPLGVEHVAAVADAPEAERELAELDRRGLVKSSSPRYRLLRRVPTGLGAPTEDLRARLLDHLTRWSAHAKPDEVADEAEGVEALLRLAADEGRLDGALALALAAEGKLAMSGSWSSWERVLERGLLLARRLDRREVEAYFLHQLGSRSLCLGASSEAIGQLGEALRIREELGDRKGAELTRHNLGQIGGTGHGGPNGGNGFWPPRPPIVLGALAIAIAIAVAVIILTGDSDNAAQEATTKGHTRTGQTTSTSSDTTRSDTTRSDTTPSDTTPSDTTPLATPDALGHDALGHDARHDAHRTRRPRTRRPRTRRPRTRRPSDTVGQPLGHDAARHDDRSNDDRAECGSIPDPDPGGPVASGAVIDMAPGAHRVTLGTEGQHSFDVTATDEAGNQSSATATYSVIGVD